VSLISWLGVGSVGLAPSDGPRGGIPTDGGDRHFPPPDLAALVWPPAAGSLGGSVCNALPSVPTFDPRSAEWRPVGRRVAGAGGGRSWRILEDRERNPLAGQFSFFAFQVFFSLSPTAPFSL